MILEKIKQCGIVPVIKINDAAVAVPLAEALIAGGVDVIEITFRTDAAAAAIENIARDVPGMLVGAGTVLTPKQLGDAKAAGARFLVSPGLVPAMVKLAGENGLPIIPGVVTPSEICMGLNLGLTLFKFFPAESFGGIATIKALAAPFGGISFVPTGGINQKNAADYWQFSKVLAVGGSWMAPDTLINEGNFAEITRRTAEAVALMRSSRI